jgi:hypothetical protein
MADAVLEILRVIQADIAGSKTDVATVKTELRVRSRTLDFLSQEGRLRRAAVELRLKSDIHLLITALEERGFIRRLPTGRARSRSSSCLIR